MRLTESVSNGPPVTGYSLPSYLMVKLKLTTVPSFISPVLVTFIPPSGVASRTSVWLLIGLVLVVLDLAALYFQVPAILSAPNIPMAVMATPIASFATMLRIVFLSFPTLTSPRKLSGVQRRPDGPHRWRENNPRPIAPTAIPSISRGEVYHVRRPAISAELFRGIVPVAAK